MTNYFTLCKSSYSVTFIFLICRVALYRSTYIFGDIFKHMSVKFLFINHMNLETPLKDWLLTILYFNEIIYN